MVAMSARSGAFRRRSGPSDSRAAAISGSAAFLAPLIGMVPCERPAAADADAVHAGAP